METKTEPTPHKFLAQPRGKWRREPNDRCWEVVNMVYCGQPPDAAVHQVAPQRCSGNELEHGLSAHCPGCAELTTHHTCGALPCSFHQPVQQETDPPPDQHVAPPRIWIDPDDGDQEWYRQNAGLDFYIEYLAATPIQAALEACEKRGVKLGCAIHVANSDWDALVASVKGDAK